MDQIKSINTKLHELQAQEEKLIRINTLSGSQQNAYLLESEKILVNRIKTGEERLRSLETKIQTQTQLLEQGLLTTQTLLSTKMEYANAKQDIDSNRNEILQFKIRSTDSQKQIQNELASINIQINETKRNLASRIRSADELSLVYSTYTGRVIEKRISENSFVTVGTPILSIEQTGSNVSGLEALIYIDPLDGKKVKPNMEVQISPSTIKREEFGVMLGKVRNVDEFPSTAAGIMSILHNEKLVQIFAPNAPPISVTSDLIASSTTFSGYKWSSPKGPQAKIESGTLCTAAITVKRQRPIALVIPMLGNLLGV